MVHAVHVDTLIPWHKTFYLEVKIVEEKVTFLADAIWLDLYNIYLVAPVRTILRKSFCKF